MTRASQAEISRCVWNQGGIGRTGRHDQIIPERFAIPYGKGNRGSRRVRRRRLIRNVGDRGRTVGDDDLGSDDIVGVICFLNEPRRVKFDLQRISFGRNPGHIDPLTG